MKWSKLKQRIEDCFADSVRGRVEVWTTRYRHAHDAVGEGWITVDKMRVHSMGTLTYWKKLYTGSAKLQAEWDRQHPEESAHIGGCLAANDETEIMLESTAAISLCNFNDALFEYLNLSIDQILNSDKTIIRALGMFDRRLGKRRLRALDMNSEQELVRRFFGIRCEAEGVSQ
ncbi:SF0329 family protein [Defluviimonas salinarum]|uniref:Uncharacterized protein n=1 Tax=Defluviimonas salinarum TaxID=2992147 RepID=A0ABT3J616_9RHOB|nr:hypothetical protein [Defluviimonas salinarum]MCW3783140.1 hypothetical protein [Defluviimonas salinarum]